MIILSFFLVLLASFASCADHDVFKNCSRVPFCESLRGATPKLLLTAQLDKYHDNDNWVSIPLTNSDEQELFLYVSLLHGSTARIKILEKDSKRYELADVLEEEPKTVKLEIDDSKENSLLIKPASDKYTHRIIVMADPLQIKFYYDENTLQSIVDGSDLIFDDTAGSQAFSFAVELKHVSRLYGLHHHTVSLELPITRDSKEMKMEPFRLRNSDTANYEIDSPMALYGSVPVVYGHSENTTSGIFLHNAAEQWVDILNGTSSFTVKFMVESAALDLFVFLGNSPKDVVRQFTQITGVAHMPQLWTFGYHQCRWSYYTQDEAKDVVAKMDANDLPMDALWLDIDYTDGYRYFTWNPTNYSDPIELQKYLSSTNRKLVTILDPHIKKDENYAVYAEAKGKHFVKWANGSDFEGNCWPGLSSYLDFLNPETRDYYAKWYSYEKFVNSTPTLAGIWNDMNEPSVFDNATEHTMPFELLHYGNVTHRDIHNIYGFLQTKATHQGLMERDNNTKRPFILTRSHFAGSQRYAAMWTGDNTADWPYLRVSYSECILSNLVGLAFCGADVGGFFNDPSGDELVERWYQAGIWLPFYRGHSSFTTKRREPYIYSANVQKVIRTALRTRYQHIPMWYTVFYEHTRTGDPVIRPLFYEYPGTVDKDHHILLGSDILARPVMDEKAADVSVTFPGDENVLWYRVDDNSFKVYKGNSEETLPVNITTSPYFYKGGSIIFRKDRPRPTTEDALNDPYSVYVNLDNTGNANGRLYVDDFTSFEYKNKNVYCYLNLTYIPQTGGLNIEQIDGNCAADIEVNVDHVYIHKPTAIEGEYTKIVHTQLADGTPLKKSNIVPQLSKDSGLYLQL